MCGGEDGGKSFGTAKELLPHVLAPSKDRRLFPLFGPTYVEPRLEFDYLLDDLNALGFRFDRSVLAQPREGAWWLSLKHPDLGVHSIIRTYSAQDPTSIRAIKPDGIIVAEAGKVAEAAIGRFEGRASAKDAFMVLSGTMEATERWYPDYWKDGQMWHARPSDEQRYSVHSVSLPTWANTVNYPAGRNDPKIKVLEERYSEDYFVEHCAGIPVPPRGLVIKEIDAAKHVAYVDFNRGEPVFLWIDPGYHAYAVLAVQRYGDRVWVIDEVYERNKITSEIIAICRDRPWWPNVPTMGRGALGGVIDVAGLQHHAMAAPAEAWRNEAGIGLAANKYHLPWVLERIRSSLKEETEMGPRIQISPKCHGLLAEAGIGDPPWDGVGIWKYKTDRAGRPYDERPPEDNCDAWKALGYGLTHEFGYVDRHTKAVAFNYKSRMGNYGPQARYARRPA